MYAWSLLAWMFVLAVWSPASLEQAITCTAGHFAAGQTATVTCNFPQDVTTSRYHLYVGWKPFSGSTSSKEKAIACHKSSNNELICGPADGFRLLHVIKDHLTLEIPDVEARFAGRYTCHHVPKHGKRTLPCNLTIGDDPATSKSTSRRTTRHTTNTPEPTTETGSVRILSIKDVAQRGISSSRRTPFHATSPPETTRGTDVKTMHVQENDKGSTTVTAITVGAGAGFFVLVGVIGGVVLLLVIFAVVVTVVLAVLSHRRGRTENAPSAVGYLRDIRRPSVDDVVFRRVPRPPKSDSDATNSSTSSHYAVIADEEGSVSQNIPLPPRSNIRRPPADIVISLQLQATPALQNEIDSSATSSPYDDIDDSEESTLSHLSQIYFDSSSTSESTASDYYLHPVTSSCEATNPAAIATATKTTIAMDATAYENTASASDTVLHSTASRDESAGKADTLTTTEATGTAVLRI